MSTSVAAEPEVLARALAASRASRAAALPFAGSLHVPWATDTALNRNPCFAKALDAKVGPKSGNERPVLLLCRSGKRSALAAAAKAGIANVFNVQEGFEGDTDERRERGHFNGWRFHSLPWEQD
jgi:rhodanese-related sulfurtransferase